MHKHPGNTPLRAVRRAHAARCAKRLAMIGDNAGWPSTDDANPCALRKIVHYRRMWRLERRFAGYRAGMGMGEPIQARRSVPAPHGDSPIPTESLHTRHNAHGAWRRGCAHLMLEEAWELDRQIAHHEDRIRALEATRRDWLGLGEPAHDDDDDVPWQRREWTGTW